MEDLPGKKDILVLLLKIAPPIALTVMAKLSADYREGKRVSVLSTIVITALASVGAIVGYWITMWIGWTHYKQALTIFMFGMLADKLIEFLFSKYFINVIINSLQDAILGGLRSLYSSIKNKK